MQGLAASNVAVLTGELWPVKSAGATPELSAPTAPFLQVVEADFLSQIHDDLRSLDADSTSSETVALCEKFAEGVGIALARQAGTRVAVFAEEEGALTLMAHSSLSKRQVTFEFRSDRRITITSIDEGMRRTQLKCGPDHLLTLGNAIAWLSRPT